MIMKRKHRTMSRNKTKSFILSLLIATSAVSLSPFLVLPKVYAGGNTEGGNNQQSQPATGDAQEVKRPEAVDCKNSLKPNECGITKYIVLLINVLSATLGVVVTAVIIVAGIQYSASAGNPQAAAAAKKRITNAILALVFFACMYGFLQWIVPGGVL